MGQLCVKIGAKGPKALDISLHFLLSSFLSPQPTFGHLLIAVGNSIGDMCQTFMCATPLTTSPQKLSSKLSLMCPYSQFEYHQHCSHYFGFQTHISASFGDLSNYYQHQKVIHKVNFQFLIVSPSCPNSLTQLVLVVCH